MSEEKKIFWVASYPKSGNTLFRAILSSLFFTNDGVFTFPSTGVYQIIGNLVVSRDAAENRYANFNLEVSTDGGSSYDIAAMGSGGFGQVYQRDTCSLCFLLDVTNTSNVKDDGKTVNASNV